MKTLSKQKSAFTLIELTFVIVILGILAALAIPRIERDLKQEAADNILSAIRYTQNLALIDDKTDPFDNNWQKKLWMIQFNIDSTGKDSFYTVCSDNSKDGAFIKEECATDPINGNYMHSTSGGVPGSAESNNIFIGKKYGINNLNLNTSGCGSQHIAFDQFGRPHSGIDSATNNYSTYMIKDCNLTFSFIGDTDSFNIIIEKETGYAYIDGQPNS